MGGKKTFNSGRSSNSGYMPLVCSKSAWRKVFSVILKRAATPGSHHTGSTAILVTTILPLSSTSLHYFLSKIYVIVHTDHTLRNVLKQLGHQDVGLSDRNRRPDVAALINLFFENQLGNMAPWVQRHDLLLVAPLRLLLN